MKTTEPTENKLIIDFNKIQKMTITLGEIQMILKDIKITINSEEKK